MRTYVLVRHHIPARLGDASPPRRESFGLPCLVNNSWNALDLAMCRSIPTSSVVEDRDLGLGKISSGVDSEVVGN
jgi:hypothetical protein